MFLKLSGGFIASYMNIVVDAGNTFLKAALFDSNGLVSKKSFASATELKAFLGRTPAQHVLVSTVSHPAEELLTASIVVGKKINLYPELPTPLKNKYATPLTLGVDRMAAACGAWALYPLQNSLVIDMGTCINYELVTEAGEYKGGAISPGVQMRANAMHSFTAQLPAIRPTESWPPLTGDSTVTCLQSGVMNGTLEEIKGTIARYQERYPGIRVILCGGDAPFFENHLKPSIFVAPDLVLLGLNSILMHNVGF